MAESARIVYTVTSFDPNTHRGEFQLDVHDIGAPSVELALPVWAPGAYEVRDSGREVRSIVARAGAGGTTLPIHHVTKNRWRIETGGSATLVVQYTVYGRELTDDGLDITNEHLYLNATRCFPWVDGRADEPVEVVFHLPAGWSVHAELPRVAEHPPRFRAANYEELVDTPFDCGTPAVVTIRPGGIPHHLVLCGGPGNYEMHRIEEDVATIVQGQIRYFGGSPVPSFTFFLHVSDRRDGGLEHRQSTSIVLERNSFRPGEDYERFLGTVAHEYLHLYNVKRVRPAVLGPFDFDREVYTRQLWWMEGTTDYLAHLLLRRSGLFTPSRYLERFAELAKTYLSTPGRSVKSLEEASFDAWIDLYRLYEESRNQSINYYNKGHLVSACLDLEIRARTENERSLDSVMLRMWREYGQKDRGIPEGALVTIAQEATGLDLTEFFDRYIRGTDEVDLDRFLRLAGLSFGPAPKGPEASRQPEPGYLGIDFQNDNGRVRVREVLDGTAARRAGLSPGDEIIALDGMRVLHEGFIDRLRGFPPGSKVGVDLFRRGVLQRITVAVGAPPPSKYAITPVPAPTELARKVYQGWLETPWTPAPGGATATAEPKA